MKVQVGKKTGKQASERMSIGQAPAPARAKNGLNGCAIHAHFRKKGFYSAYTPQIPPAVKDLIADRRNLNACANFRRECTAPTDHELPIVAFYKSSSYAGTSNCTEHPLFQHNQYVIDFTGPENPRVGGSIPPLATIKVSRLPCFLMARKFPLREFAGVGLR